MTLAAVVSLRALDAPTTSPSSPPASSPSPPTAADAPDPALTRAPSGAPSAADRTLDAVRDLLDRRAAALATGDRDGFLATLDDADPEFVAQQAASYDNLQLLGVTQVRYGVDDRMLPVSPVLGDDPELKPTVVEHVQLAGVDTGLVSHEVGFTFVRRDGTWLLGAERIDETQRTLSSIGVSRPWAEGPVAVQREGVLTVVVDEERAHVLPALTGRAVAALGYVQDQLGTRDDEPLLVDATSTGVPTRLSHAGTSVAGATFGPAMTMRLTGHEPVEVGGWRIKYNPDSLDTFLDDDRILRHELTHFVLREHDRPLWLVEGLAEYLSWRRAPMTRLFVPRGTFRRLAEKMPYERLLDDPEFHRIPTVAYTGSQALVEELVARRDLAAVVELLGEYRGLRESGVPRADLDRRALLRTFSVSEAVLARAGYRRLMEIQHP